MEKKDAYHLIYTGLMVRHLLKIESNFTLARTIKLLNSLKTHLTESGLKVTENGFINFLDPISEKLSQQDENEEIGDEVRLEIKQGIEKLEPILFSEATIKHVYIVPERRYNGEYLANNPTNLLNSGVYHRLPEMAAFDFSSSCKCILYGEGTACAFHILRATEEVLKHFYFKYKKTKRLRKPMWGPMTSELRAKRSNKPQESILDTLDLVRTNYRNPTQHPEVKYDIESAQDLFGVCIDLINKMAQELDESI